MFYCFVELGEIQSAVYVVPARKVAKVVADSHQAWLNEPGKNGRVHNDTVMRWITNDYPRDIRSAKPGWMDEYLENWALIQ
jgi:hypothetical protein